MSSESKNKGIYFDNAATSFPKPDVVVEEVVRFMTTVGANPGRSAYPLAVESSELVCDAREGIADFFGEKNPMRVIFTSNATEALNFAIQGVVRAGDKVVTSSMEHNSTIRVLKEMEKREGIDLSIVCADSKGLFDVINFDQALQSDVNACVVNHGSNVTGTLAPIKEIGRICRQRGIVFIVDCSQSAGCVEIDINDCNIDLLAFTGHKGLLGPTGTGGLVISSSFDHTRITPLKFGGTGSFSDKVFQPDFLPDSLESGTLNVAGIAGLLKGIEYIKKIGGVSVINKHKKKLVKRFFANVPREIIFYTDQNSIETGVVSFNLKGVDTAELSLRLSEDFGIMTRPGLHCAPLAHQTVGSFPDGSVRFSFGIFNSEDEVDLAIGALKRVIG